MVIMVMKNTLIGTVQSKWLKPFIGKSLTLIESSETDSIFVKSTCYSVKELAHKFITT